MTVRLYYTDSYLKSFNARITEMVETGNGFRVILDETAFYPESGGQPPDKGTLNGVPVENVQEDEAGNVVHLVSKKLNETLVKGEIDFECRFDHMQHHTGQHILSGAFHRLYRLKTVGFHMGPDTCTIDLDTSAINSEHLSTVVRQANAVVWENRVVRIGFYDTMETDKIGLRKPTKRRGEIRVVEIEDFDRSACGGTHVGRTGEVGMIFVPKTERMKGNVRVHFVCGGKAYRLWENEHDVLSRLSASTTTGYRELPQKIERLIQTTKQLEKDCVKLKNQLLEEKVPALIQQGQIADGVSIVAVSLDEPAQVARFLCKKLIAVDDGVGALVASKDDGVIVMGRTSQLDLDITGVVDELRKKYSLKGGGRSDFAQIGGISREMLSDVMQDAEIQFRTRLSGE